MLVFIPLVGLVIAMLSARSLTLTIGVVCVIFLILLTFWRVSTCFLLYFLVVAMPFTEVPWLGLPYGIGLITVIIGLLAFFSLTQIQLTNKTILVPRFSLLAFVFICTALLGSVLVAHTETVNQHSLKVINRYAGRVFLVPIVIMWAFLTLKTKRQDKFLKNARNIILGLGILGVIISALQTLFGIGYFIPGDYGYILQRYQKIRAIGLAASPGQWGTFMILPLSLALANYLRSKRASSGVLTTLMALGILLTGLRSAWLGGLASAVWLMLCFIKKGKVLSTSLPLLVIFAMIFMVFPGLMGDVFGRLYLDPSIGDRLVIWYNAWGLFLRSPLVGIGLGNLAPTMAKITWETDFTFPFRGDIIGQPVEAHNFFLSILTETGIIGFSLFLVVIIAGWQLFSKARQAAKQDVPSIGCSILGYQAAFLGVLISGIGQNLIHHFSLWWLLAIALVWNYWIRQKKLGAARGT